MSIEKQFPILEFDNNREAYLEPRKIINQVNNMPEGCVITFFREAIEKKKARGELKQIALSKSETIDIPVYEAEYQGKKIAVTLGIVGAAGSAALLEELIAMGSKKFIVCGGAGVLQKDIAVGHLILPTAAIRDEGLSYHYMEPSREVEMDKLSLEAIERELIEKNISYVKGKTWTTDAIYRETKDKVALRVWEGCLTVEMEAAAFFAVSKFRKVHLGQILYGGDDLSGETWDGREWNSREDIRENLVDLAMDICGRML